MASIPGLWTEHQNQVGRSYWYNTMTKESVWEKPDVLRTPVERALAQTQWKESQANGKKYYYHKETKESKWELPDEVKEIMEKAEKEGQAAVSSSQVAPPNFSSRLIAPNFTGGTILQGANSVSGSGGDLSLVQAGAPGPLTINGTGLNHTDLATPKPSGILPARPNLPEDPIIPHNGFLTYEEGEKAFFHLLRKAGVDPTWTWEQTMRAVITDPLYKALNTLAERKGAWQKFVDDIIRKEQEEKDARLNKLRPALRNMLKGNPMVHHYTTFQTADKIFAQHPIWQQAKLESERKLIFEEYVAELKHQEISASREARARSVNKVMALFKSLGVDELTRWRSAYAMVLRSDEWKNDEELKQLPALDVLLAFEDYSRVKEREFEENMRRAAVEKTAKERKAREGFKALLQELLEQKLIKGKTPWKAVYPRFAKDERYLSMLGNPGSTPLELYWDEVDKLDKVFDASVEKVEAILKEKGFEHSLSTTREEFKAVLAGENIEDVGLDVLDDIYAYVQHQAKRQKVEEQKRAERKQRRMQDDLRYALKKIEPPINLDSPYEEAVPMMQALPEYVALDDEGRKASFAKFVKRQKEKLREPASEDGNSITSKKRKGRSSDRHDHDRDADREKDKGHDKSKDSEGDQSSKRHRSDNYDRRDKDYRDRERDHSYRDKDKDRGSSRRDSHRDRDRGRDRDRDEKRGSSGRRRDYGRGKDDRDWDEHRHQSREPDRSRDEARKEYDDDMQPEGEKHDRSHRSLDRMDSVPARSEGREESPEEGEI